MSEQTVDLDAVTEQAWRDFREALADALEGLGEGAYVQVGLDIGVETEGATPYVQARLEGESVLLEVVSNRFLGDAHRLSKPARRHLRGLGLAKPSESQPNYWAGYARSHVDQAAAVAVSAFRVAFGVVHPAFLRTDDFTWGAEGLTPSPETRSEAAATYPVDREHLHRLVDETLTPMLGHPPHRDCDGDIPICAGSAVVFVRSQGRLPLIRLFAQMVTAISDLEAAADEVAELIRAVEGVKFTLVEDWVVASADLLALPFAPQHLLVLVARVCDVVSGDDARLARRVGGRVFLDPGDEGEDATEDGSGAADGIPRVMVRMLRLEAEKPGSLRPKVVAKLCGYDTDLLHELIRWNEEQQEAWRAARDEATAIGEYDEAEAFEHERAHARHTVRVLRKALRRVLLG